MTSIRPAQNPPRELAVPVVQEHTHKTAPDEVLLVDWRRTGRDNFTVQARWPSSHDFYPARSGLHDPMLLGETVRQTLPMLSHAAYGVPIGHQLLWRDLRWDLDTAVLHVEQRPTAVELRVTCTDVEYRRTVPTAMTLSAEVLRDGVHLADARTRFAIRSRTVYERLRGPYADLALSGARALPPAPPVPARTVGRDRARDVTLSPGGNAQEWLLRVDTSHPFLFDHPVDHVPGMLLLEAGRQAARATTSLPGLVVGTDTAFVRYAELDAPCRIRTCPLPEDGPGRRRVLVTAHQHDEEIFTDIVTLAELPQR